MEAGRLRHRVTFQAKVPTRDTHGGEVPNWADQFTVWGRVEFLELLSMKEFFAARQIHARADARITVRYRTGIDSDMRVTWDGHTFEIVAPPIQDATKRELAIICQEVT